MVTKEDLKQAIWKYDKVIHSGIRPDKVWEYKAFIEPKLNKIPNIKVIYPKNLFGDTDEPIEIIILTEDNKLMHGIIKKQSNAAYSFDIEEINPTEVEINYNKDNNYLDCNFGLDFSSNFSFINNFIVKSLK